MVKRQIGYLKANGRQITSYLEGKKEKKIDKQIDTHLQADGVLSEKV